MVAEKFLPKVYFWFFSNIFFLQDWSAASLSACESEGGGGECLRVCKRAWVWWCECVRACVCLRVCERAWVWRCECVRLLEGVCEGVISMSWALKVKSSAWFGACSTNFLGLWNNKIFLTWKWLPQFLSLNQTTVTSLIMMPVFWYSTSIVLAHIGCN